jgi:flagellar protein FlbD
VIYVTRLDGSQLVVNADLIETVEHTADTVITLIDGKKLVVRTLVEDVVDRVVGYRQTIARGPLRSHEGPPLHAPVAVLHNEPTPLRPGKAH